MEFHKRASILFYKNYQSFLKMNRQENILLNKIYLLNHSIYYSYLNLINNLMIYILYFNIDIL